MGKNDRQSRATFERIGVLAGVSVSTVDRVINGRGGVAPDKSSRVLDAAQALGFGRSLPELWQATRRIEVILPKNATPFWRSLDSAFQSYGAEMPRHYVLHRTLLKEKDTSLWEKAILQPAAPRSALIIAADGGSEFAPLLQTAIGRGETVVTVTTEVPDLSGHGHSGIDNFAAGRTAGYLLAGLAKHDGVMLILVPHERRVEHSQRIGGFRAAVGHRFEVKVISTNEVYHRIPKLLSAALANDEIVGLYDTGHDSVEIGEVLRRLPLRPAWVAHEKSENHQRLMREDLLSFVIDQNPGRQASWAIFDVLRKIANGSETVFGQHPPELSIYCRENM